MRGPEWRWRLERIGLLERRERASRWGPGLRSRVARALVTLGVSERARFFHLALALRYYLHGQPPHVQVLVLEAFLRAARREVRENPPPPRRRRPRSNG